MKLFNISALVGLAFAANAQDFPTSIEPEFGAKEVRLIETEVKPQVLLIGGVSEVQTTETYGNAAGTTPAKQWNDFIGFTPNTEDENEGWVSVNHERIEANDMIGDGGGMTVFKIKMAGDTLQVVDQTLEDGRAGKYFNVDFVNTVGETGMNCGGIVSDFDGRIWTAEEWFRTSNKNISYDGAGIRDTADWKIDAPEFPEYHGKTIKKYENLNYMVEIDPKQAKAVRKQYNWGRQGFEGGVVLPDNKTVFLGPDATPGFFGKFVAETAGDFTKGQLYAYKHDADSKWVELDMSTIENVTNHYALAQAAGATMYNRIEWVTFDKNTNAVYFTATGRDNPGSKLKKGADNGAVIAPHHIERATAQGTTWDSSEYADYYGRIMKLDLATDEISVFLEAGPDVAEKNASICSYPEIHLSNPDGLTTYTNPNGGSYLIIQEDLNGDTYGRTPSGTYGNFGKLRTCEMFALDLSIENPTIEDLQRIAIIPYGAEITGARSIFNGKTLLVNSQHPNSANPYPYNNSLTIAINGIDKILSGGKSNPVKEDGVEVDGFTVYPNPTASQIMFDEPTNVAIYDINGARVGVYTNVTKVNVANYPNGTYFVRNEEGKTAKLIKQ